MVKNYKVAVFINASRAPERTILAGISEFSKFHPNWIFFRPTPKWDEDKSFSPKEFLKKIKPDAIIIEEEDYFKFVHPTKLPTIVLSYFTQRIENVISVTSDYRAIAEMAAYHLMECGASRFAFCGYTSLWGTEVLKNEYCDILKKFGYETEIFPGGSLTKWIKSLPQPIAILADTDEKALEISEVCQDLNIHVPDEIAILGINNDELICQLTPSPISSIELAAKETGMQFCKSLEDIFLKKRKKEDTHFTVNPLRVEKRLSTSLIRVENLLVKNALRLIEQNGHEKIKVEGLARKLGVSRRTLERDFKEKTKKTIHQKIEEDRISRMKKYLANTNMSVKEISDNLGYMTPEHVYKFFKKHTGVSPVEWRTQNQLKKNLLLET